MKKLALLIATAIMVITNVHAFDVKLLANNKETYSREITKKDLSSLALWKKQHRLQAAELKASSIKALSETFNEMERIDTNCELGLVARLQADAIKYGVISNSSEILDFIIYLRSSDIIDDILFKMMMDSTKINQDFVSDASLRPRRPFNVLTRQNANVDLVKLYAPFKTWPDDIKKCTLDTYFSLSHELTWKSGKDRDGQLQKLNYLAYNNEVIDLATYNKLEVLRERQVLEWNIYFKRYADVINNAKDKLTKNPELQAKNDFTVEYVSRKEKLTNRGNLYRTYNSTQIMMLAQIIEKTAKRMDSRQVSLNWQYTDDPNGEIEVYIFSPMEQYRAAIKMLRKDMAEVMRSDAFKNSGLQYEHLISAAYEAGFIKSKELDYVLKFEDFWNPKTPKWKTYANFAFSLAGTAAFYLPPPWNIIGAIGLVLTQSKLVKGDQNPDEDDNWNVIL